MSLTPVSELGIQRGIGSLILHVILDVAPLNSYQYSPVCSSELQSRALQFQVRLKQGKSCEEAAPRCSTIAIQVTECSDHVAVMFWMKTCGMGRWRSCCFTWEWRYWLSQGKCVRALNFSCNTRNTSWDSLSGLTCSFVSPPHLSIALLLTVFFCKDLLLPSSFAFSLPSFVCPVLLPAGQGSCSAFVEYLTQ